MVNDAKFVLSKSIVKEQFNKVNKLADKVSYSFKTNYEVGKILEKETQCLFSVHSFETLKLLNDMSRVIYFAQGWDKKEVNELLHNNVNIFVIDNKKDLNILLNMLQTTNNKITLFLRMKLKENTIHTGKHFVFGLSSGKVNDLVKILKKNNSIKSIGIHFHRKTQNVSEWSIKEELEDSISDETWSSLSFINIGGGLPYIYKNYSKNILEPIFQKLMALKQYINSKNVKMYIEPGRFIAAPAVKLIATVKNVYDNNIILNCSVYNSAMDTFIAHIRLLVENETETGKSYTLKGCTPDSLDIFRYKVYLKKKPKINDRIVFLNAGAYNFSTDFCKLPKLKTEIIN